MRTPVLAFAFAAVSVGGCGNPPPAMNQDMAMPDLAPTVDMIQPVDLVLANHGSKLVGGDVQLAGVTDDSHVVYWDNAQGNTTVVAIDGTGTNPIEADNQSVVAISHDAVFVWHNVDNSNNGALGVWTPKTGNTAEVAKGTSVAGLEAATVDGAYVAFIDNFNNGFGDLVSVKADGTNRQTLKMGISAGSPCTPQLQFAGALLIASYCLPPSDAGAQVRVASSFDPASGNETVLQADAGAFFSVDKAGKYVALSTSAHVGAIVAAAGGAPLVGNLADFDYGLFTGDGGALVYKTATAGGLSRVPVAMNGTPTALQMGGVDGLDALSPDGKFMVFHSATDPNSGFTDLKLAPADSAAAATTLFGMTTATAFFAPGDPFTTDSSNAIFFENLDPMTNVGDWVAAPVGNPSMTNKLGSSVWLGFAAGGAKVVFNDNWKPDPQSAGHADIEVIDLSSKGATPMLIAEQAAADILVTVDHTRVVYGFDLDMSRAGIYTASIP